MPGATVRIVSGQSLSLTVQFFTQDTFSYVNLGNRNGTYYATTSATFSGNYAYSATLNYGTGYSNGDVWTVQVGTTYTSYWGNTVSPVASSTASTLIVLSSPSITSQPVATQTVVSGASASFSVTATGAAPLAYQWRDNGASISGATNSSYSLSAARTSDAGSYTVVITNAYGSITSSISALTVNKATPSVTTWPTASGITYLQALSASTLSGGSASVGGVFAFTTPATTPPVGSYSASVTFTPTDTANYNTVTNSVNVAVAKATPVVSTWPTASGITYLQDPLGIQLERRDGFDQPGSFAFVSPTNAPNAGTYYAAVKFTPSSSGSYNAVTGTVAVAVSKAASSVTAWPSASAITYGQKLTASSLGSGTATPGGTFAFTAPLTAPNAGSYTAGVTFTPTDTADYTIATSTVQVTVNKATPVVSVWPAGSAIVYGQPLSASPERGQRLNQRQFHLQFPRHHAECRRLQRGGDVHPGRHFRLQHRVRDRCRERGPGRPGDHTAIASEQFDSAQPIHECFRFWPPPARGCLWSFHSTQTAWRPWTAPAPTWWASGKPGR